MAAIIKIENLYKVYSVGKEKVVALGEIGRASCRERVSLRV